MKSSSNWIDSIVKKHKLDSRKKKILVTAIALVLVVTAVIMRLPASTATAELICGQEEHTHTDSCYTEEQVLICGQEESEEHTHDESCYETERTLTCDKEEHTHTADCYEKGGTLTASAGSMNVEVSYEAGVIHEGTSLSASQKSESSIQDQIDNDLSGEDRVSSIIEAYDLSLYKDGNDVQPDGTVSVKMKLSVPGTANSQWRFYHLADNGNLIDMTNEANIKTDGNNTVTEVDFQTGGFSVYILAATEQKAAEEDTTAYEEETTEAADDDATAQDDTEAADDSEEAVSSDDATEAESSDNDEVASAEETSYPEQDFDGRANGVTVTVSADEGAFPEGTTMKVKAVKDEDVLDAAIIAADTEDAKAKAVDISFYNKDGKEIEPQLPIRVTLKADVVASTGDVTVVHVDDNNKADVVEQTTDEYQSKDEVIFDADAFSTYAIVYTVDFKFGDYEYSMEGGTSMKLSELLSLLNIKKNSDGDYLTVLDIGEVTFSDETLLKVTRSGKNWILESLQAFTSEETLTLTLTGGEIVEIKVTDSQTTTKLNDLQSGFSITGATKNSDGSYTVSAGDTYTINLAFAETTSLQFSMDGDLVYELPDGFEATTTAGTGTISTKKGNVTFTYTIKDGKITIHWTDTDSEAFTALKQSQYAKLNLNIEGTFNGDASEVKFSDDANGTVKVESEHGVTLNKTGYYSASDNKIHYTVTVTSKGHNNNINISDAVEGSAITYTPGSVTANPSKGSTTSDSTSGFTYHIDSMSDGEVITLSYTADVDMTKISQNEDGTYGTYDETKNTVTGTNGGDTIEPKTFDLSNQISYSSIYKTYGDLSDTANDSEKTLSWKIVANSNANVSLAGKKITDTITTPETMEYSGTGITVVVTDKDGRTIRTETIPWGTNDPNGLGVLTKDGNTWTYIVPTGDGNYTYTITYDTTVTVSDTDTIKAGNKVTDEFGDESTSEKYIGQSGTDTPQDSSPRVEKTHTKVDIGNKEITWKIVVDVPATGYSTKLEVWDTYPVLWQNVDGTSLITARDALKDDSVNVSIWNAEQTEQLEFQENESYETDTSDPTKLGIIFYYTDETGEKKSGLAATDEARKVVITLTTTIDSDFLKAMETDDNAKYHINNVKVEADNNVLSDTDTVSIDTSEMSVSKSNYGLTMNNVEGIDVPAYQFYVLITGISDSSFTDGKIIFEDTYDSTYFDFLTHPYLDWEAKNGYVYGGTINNPYIEGYLESKVLTKDPDEDGKLIITLDQNTLPRQDNGDYYSVYAVPYYLSVKSADAYEKLKEEAAYNIGGVYTLSNTIKNDKFEASDSVDYEVDNVTKKATDAVLNSDTGNYEVTYTLTVNPNAYRLGEDAYLEVIDTSTNLNIDISSITITPSLGASWNRTENGLTFTIPNEQKTTITYKAIVVGTPQSDGKVHYENTAEIRGQKKTTSDSQDISSSADGEAVDYSMKVYKQESGDSMTALAGVKFDLYVLNDGYLDDSSTKDDDPSAYSDSSWVKVNTKSAFVTDASGYINLDADTLEEHDNSDAADEHVGLYRRQWYKLVEVEVPTINGVEYQKLESPVYFWIDDTADVDYANNIYANADTILISNTPKTDTIGFSVKKTWDDSTVAADDLPDSITIDLYQKAIGANNSTGTKYKSITLSKDEFGSDLTWTGVFTDLPKGYAYFIKEQPIEGFAATYEDENTIGYRRSGTIELTNKKQAITVEKKWYDSSGNEISDPSGITSIKVNLLKDGVFEATYELTEKDNWKLTLDQLDFTGTYTFEEQSVSGYRLMGDITYTPEDSDDSNTTGLDGGGTVTISNKPGDTPDSGKTDIKVSKKWYDASGDEITDSTIKQSLVAEVQLVRYRTELPSNTVTLHFYKYNNNWPATYDKFYEDVYVIPNDNNTVTVKFNAQNRNDAPILCVLTSPVDTTVGYWDTYQNNTNVSKASSSYSGNWSSSEISYTFTVPSGASDIYLVGYIDKALFSNLDITGYEPSSSGKASLDTTYLGSVLTLDSSNSWASAFENLPLIGTGEDGKVYAYSYGVKEISSSQGFTLDTYYSGDNDITNSDGTSQAASDIVVNNKQTQNIEMDFKKEWSGLSDIMSDDNTTLLSKLRLVVQLERYSGDSSTPDADFANTEAGKPFILNGVADVSDSESYSSDTSYGVPVVDKYVELDPTSSTTWNFKWYDLAEEGIDSSGNTVKYTYKVKEIAVYLANGEALESGDLFYGLVSDYDTIAGHEYYYRVTDLFEQSYATDGQTITNTLKNISLSFAKRWTNDSDTFVSWENGASITVKLYGDFTYQGGSQSGIKLGSYIISKGSDGNIQITKESDSSPDLTLDTDGTTGTNYQFSFGSLPLTGSYTVNSESKQGSWSYYVQEEKADGYETSYYATVSGDKLQTGSTTDKTSVKDGEVIVNRPEASYELPSTGGTGINSYLLGGTFLSLISITLFLLLIGRAFLERRKRFRS